MMLLRLQFVQKLLPLTEENRDYLFHLAKNPKRARRVHEQFAYGWSQVGTTLWEQFRRHGVWDAEDEEKSAEFKTGKKKSPSTNAEAAPSPSEADSGVSGVPGPGPDGGRPDGGGAGALPVVPRPEVLWGLLDDVLEDDADLSPDGDLSPDHPPDEGDDVQDLFKSV